MEHFLTNLQDNASQCVLQVILEMIPQQLENVKVLPPCAARYSEILI